MGLQQSSPAGMARPSRAGKVRSREERAQRDGAVTASPHATQLLDGAAAQLRQLCSDWERATHGTEEQQDESARTLLAEVDEVLARPCALNVPSVRATCSSMRACSAAAGGRPIVAYAQSELAMSCALNSSSVRATCSSMRACSAAAGGRPIVAYAQSEFARTFVLN